MSINVERINGPDDFDRVAANMVDRIGAVGDIDYRRYYRDLQDLQHPLGNVFDPTALAQDMVSVQGYKDRAVEIVHVLTENYLVHKRVVEVLTKGWPMFSMEKSAEKREGEALLKMSGFLMAATDAEVAYRHAMGVLKNLESQMDSVSRQIACAQAAAKISFPGTAYDTSNPFTRREEPDCAFHAEAGDGITDWDKLDS